MERIFEILNEVGDGVVLKKSRCLKCLICLTYLLAKNVFKNKRINRIGQDTVAYCNLYI